MNILERAKSIKERAKGIRERAKSIAQSIGKRAKRTLSHYAFTEGRNPDPASYAVETLNSIIAYNNEQGWFNIYKGAMAGFIRIFKCFDEFKCGHIEGLHMISGNLGEQLMHYCGHNNLFRRNCDKLPGLVATGRDMVAKLLQDTQFQQFCENIDPFRELQIDYSKRDFKAALFMHNNLESFMNALFVDTNPIATKIEEGIRPIKCWLSMFFSEETLHNISENVREEYLNTLALPSDKQFLDYPNTIVQKVSEEMKSSGFVGGARKRTARVPRKQRKQRKQCKSRKQRK